MLSKQLEINQRSVHTILHEVLSLKKLWTKFVLPLTNGNTKGTPGEASRNFIAFADSNDNF